MTSAQHVASVYRGKDCKPVACRACNDTGFTDYAWLSIDPCSCAASGRSDADETSVVNGIRHKPTLKQKMEKTLSVMTLTPHRRTSIVPSVSTKKVAMRVCSRYEQRRPARPVLRSALLYGRAHREAFGPAGFGNVHRSANSVLPDLQNCSRSKGPLAGTLPFDRAAASSCPSSIPHRHDCVSHPQGGAHV